MNSTVFELTVRVFRTSTRKLTSVVVNMAQHLTTTASSPASSLVESIANLDQQYIQKYEEQQALINKLQAENDELRSYDRIDESLMNLSIFPLIISLASINI